MEDTRPPPNDREKARVILESILGQPSTREADTRVKRRIRAEMRRLLKSTRQPGVSVAQVVSPDQPEDSDR